MTSKHGHELLCDCGQPLGPEGVCTSCNPPEEQEDLVLERESHDPKPLNFDKNQERVYEHDFVDDYTMLEEDTYDPDYYDIVVENL